MIVTHDYFTFNRAKTAFILQVVSYLATGQLATVGIYEELERQGNSESMTFETNGTKN